MINEKNFKKWRAEAIAKLYLLNSGLVALLPNYSDKYEFLAISKNAPDKNFAIEIKATKCPKREIKRVFHNTRRKFTNYSLPVILMYVNYDDMGKGYFEVFKKNSRKDREIQSLEVGVLKETISELIA
jgi:hypothetical protein